MTNEIKVSDIDIERKVLKLCMFNESSIEQTMLSGITEDDFFNNCHKTIYKTMYELFTDEDLGGNAVKDEQKLITERIDYKNDEKFEKQILLALQKIKTVNNEGAEIELDHLKNYIDLLKNYSFIRKISIGINNINKYLIEGKVTKNELITTIEDNIVGTLYDEGNGIKIYNTKDLVKETIDDIIEESEQVDTFKLGIKDLDDNIKIMRGYLSYIGASSGVGKSTTAIHVARKFAENGARVLFVSTENDNKENIKKILSIYNREGHQIDYLRLINPQTLNKKDWINLKEMYNDDMFSKYNIWWLPNIEYDCKKLKYEITRHVRLYDIDIVIIDYYQQLKYDHSKTLQPTIEIPKVSDELRKMALFKYTRPNGDDKKIAILAMSQITKEVIYRENKRPTLNDLYFGGARDARLVLTLYRDEYYNTETEYPGIMEINIVKQNNGVSDKSFKCIFDVNQQCLREIDYNNL